MRVALILLLLNSFPSISQIADSPKVELPEFPQDSIIVDSEVMFISCPAEFPGGFDSLKRYFQNFSEFIPENWADSNFNKRGYIVFVVEEDGEITNIEVRRSITKEADQLMIQLVEKMPNWIPACDQYGSVRERVRLPVTFNNPE